VIKTQKVILAFVASAALVVAAAAPVFAQTPPPQREAPAQKSEPAPVQGDLVSVDANAKMITVKPASGPEVKFAYTDSTQVSGAKDSAAGLATLKEGRVTVHYKEDAQSKEKVATRIIVQAKE
jgi:hypothetical protein